MHVVASFTIPSFACCDYDDGDVCNPQLRNQSHYSHLNHSNCQNHHHHLDYQGHPLPHHHRKCTNLNSNFNLKLRMLDCAAAITIIIAITMDSDAIE